MSKQNTTKIQKNDYISLLAPEILIKIFDDVDTRFFKGISKSLLPYTRSRVYKSIRITTIKHFKLFIRTITNNPSIGSFVEVMDVSIRKDYSIPTEELNVKQVVPVFLAFSHLKHLTIHWCWLASIVTSKAVASTCLPLLQSLVLEDPFIHRSEPWNYEHFIHLQLFPNLYCLELYCSYKYRGLERSMIDRTAGFEVAHYGPPGNGNMDNDDFKVIEGFEGEGKEKKVDSNTEAKDEAEEVLSDSVTHMIIKGVLDNIEAVNTVVKFKSIRTLDISDDFTSENILELFNQIDSAEQIQSLSIYHSHSWHSTSDEFDLYPTISRFTGLNHLSLPAQGFTPSIFNYLRDPLPLISLSFDEDSPVSISDLKALILPGERKIATLKTLTLKVVQGRFGPRVSEVGVYREQGDTFDDYKSGFEYLEHPGWEVPEFKEGIFEEKGLIELIAIGETYGVKVVGSSVDAIGIKAAYIEDRNLTRKEWRAFVVEVKAAERFYSGVSDDEDDDDEDDEDDEDY